MSAAAKLKALEADPDFTRCMEMQRALPQIVAVLEAAEPIAAGPWPEGYAQELRAALAALDEALT